MHRRTFLKTSAIGIGTLAGMYGGVLEAEGETRDQEPVVTAHSSGGEFGKAKDEEQIAWGTNAVVLKSRWSRSPSVDDLLADREHTLALSRFYRAGGAKLPATPTECRIAYNSGTLFVVFRCEESDMSFPYANLDPSWWREADWHSLPGLPSAANNWPPNPDEVDVLIQPDMSVPSYYQFAATPQGLKFGRNRVLSPNPDAAADQAVTADHPPGFVNKSIGAFDASVTRGTNEWLVFFRIPWQTLGGKPKSHFGFLPMRTRWRDGQFSSPVAIDINEAMPVDLFIETHFSGTARVQNSESSLCRMPSGVIRWQRPAALTYPNLQTRQQIWRMESALSTPTDENNLPERLYLAQRWMDLMMQEGFTPLPGAWGVLADDLTLTFFRQKMNAAFQENDLKQACQLLDTYLSRLDRMSRWWYADGSPGNIRTDQWKSITTVNRVEAQDNKLVMRCVAGGHEVTLNLALPATGGVRIYGRDEGYWRPVSLLPLKTTETSSSCSIETGDGRIVVGRRAFSISFYDAVGNKTMQIRAADLAFRFGSDGRILATDFRNHLDPDEVIYGFGEKYDHFNENGNVLTLWGTDDWVGNGEGLANTTYKALPIFHSSKAYMVFDNS